MAENSSNSAPDDGGCLADGLCEELAGGGDERERVNVGRSIGGCEEVSRDAPGVTTPGTCRPQDTRERRLFKRAPLIGVDRLSATIRAKAVGLLTNAPLADARDAIAPHLRHRRFQMSMNSWFDWLEVRLIELPGHGFREAEPLPFDEDEMAMASLESRAFRHHRVPRLARAPDGGLTPLLGPQTAIYGFSSGAMLVYLMALEIVSRGLPPPCCVIVSGRGSPNTILRTVDGLLQKCAGHPFDNDEFVEYVRAGGVLTPDQTFPTEAARDRFCAVARSDVPIAIAEVGERPLPPEEEVDDQHVVMALNPPRLTCPITAILSTGDGMWPGNNHVDSWKQVAPLTEEGGGEALFTPIVLEGVTQSDQRGGEGGRV